MAPGQGCTHVSCVIALAGLQQAGAFVRAKNVSGKKEFFVSMAPAQGCRLVLCMVPLAGLHHAPACCLAQRFQKQEASSRSTDCEQCCLILCLCTPPALDCTTDALLLHARSLTHWSTALACSPCGTYPVRTCRDWCAEQLQ
eukprot:1159892-Pelagomonas_calceolata.AAC.21